MEFRPMYLSETEALIVLVKGLYQEDSHGQKITRDKILRTINHLSCRPDKGEIILFTNQDPDSNSYFGYAILLFMWSNEFGGDIVVVDELYVSPQHRSKGLGREFFTWLETRYTEAVAISLQITPDNTRALEFYTALGFKKEENIYMFKQVGTNQ